MDRISQLPQAVLQHILRFTSQEKAAQTSVLSKTWRNTWSTRPNINFCEYRFNPINYKKLFLPALNNTLQGYHDQNLSIEEFQVTMSIGDPESVSLLDKWIPLIICMGTVKKFRLFITSWHLQYDVFPIIFEAESFEDLDLYGCNLEQDVPHQKVIIMFKHLKKLTLGHTYIEEETFQNIILSCPLIEDLEVEDCEGLATVKVINDNLHNLKHFYFSNRQICDKWGTSIEIDVPSLESIDIEYCTDWLNVYKFPNLKSLNVEGVDTLSLGGLTPACNFPCLEKLRISDCSGYEEIDISGISIKHLDLDFSVITN